MTSVDLKAQLDLIDEATVAALLDMTVPSLRNSRARGAGPPFVKLGIRVFYRRKALEKHMIGGKAARSKKRA